MDIHTRTFHKKDSEHSCNICGYQVSQKKKIARHKVIVHEGVKYPCSQCNHKATTTEALPQHKRAVHEGTSCLLNTKGQYMKESNTLAVNAIIKLLQREVLLDTQGLYIVHEGVKYP